MLQACSVVMCSKQNLVCLADYEKQALDILPRNALGYYKSGAGEEYSLRRNKEAFKLFHIRPRVLRCVATRDQSTVVLGTKMQVPFGIAPTAMHCMADPEGECASARAAGLVGTVFTHSTLSTSSIEEVAEAAPSTVKWFQLYVYKERSITINLIERAERAGYKAIVLTVDAPLFGIRYADIRNSFKLPPHLCLKNFVGKHANDVGISKEGSGINEYVKNIFDPTLTWDDVKWLRSKTNLPIILKGILTPEDALIAAELGINGIQVSNHGARQLDGVPASIEVLQEIVNAVNNRCEIYLDGGIQQGTDIFKALALGAKMVFIGRPVLWGLACGGMEGVRNILNILKTEFDHTLALSGCNCIEDISKEMVALSLHVSKL